MSTAWVRVYLREIIEAAFPLDFSKRKLRELQEVIADHLFKFHFFPENTASNHWKSELTNWAASLAHYNNVKTKKGTGYSQKLLWQILWDEPFGTDEDLRTRAKTSRLPPAEVLSQKKEFKALVDSYIDAVYNREPWSSPP